MPLGVINVDDNLLIVSRCKALCCTMSITDAVDRLKLQPLIDLCHNDFEGTWYLCNKGEASKASHILPQADIIKNR